MKTTKRTRTPAHYAAPLRSRKAMTDWLLATFDQRFYDRDHWLLCFNVKLYRLDLSFDHLLDVAAKRGDITTHKGDPVWEAAARAIYKENEAHLYEWAVDDARGAFYGPMRDDTFRSLYDGTPVDTEFGFYGRSGGWLVLESFEGYKLSGDAAEVFGDMNFATLRLLYRFAVMLCADLTRPGLTPSARVEDAAAWALFVNLCGGDEDELPTTAKVEHEAAERHHWECRDTVTA